MKKFSFRPFRPSKGTLLAFVYHGPTRHKDSICGYLQICFNSQPFSPFYLSIFSVFA